MTVEPEEATMAEFWFNTVTGEVEEGRLSDWSQVLGPYPTREAAARALTSARTRSQAWDEADSRWSEGAPTSDGADGSSDAATDG